MVVVGARGLLGLGFGGGGWLEGATGAALCWLIRSQRRTKLSSAPDARTPRRLGDHSTQFRAAEWPLSSRRAWPGCRTSNTRTTLESWEKVASRWES